MKSEQIGELAAALAKAQGAMTVAQKNATNPHFKSRFADFESIWDAIRKPLAANGLAVVQQVRLVDGALVLDTTLMHASGQWVTSEYPVVPTQNTPQGLGSALTYAKRYALSALVGVVTGEGDDDGQAASAPVKPALPIHTAAPVRPVAAAAVKNAVEDFPRDVFPECPYTGSDAQKKVLHEVLRSLGVKDSEAAKMKAVHERLIAARTTISDITNVAKRVLNEAQIP